MADRLIVKGAREHNLRSVDLDLPRDSLIVFTGLSGSGKSSLAFDTIFAEGQRRYVESLSAYARQFLGQMDKPDVDFIEGLSPAVSIDQKSTNRNPRSTVGTITEVYDYLRLLYARAGTRIARVRRPDQKRQTRSRSSTRSWPCREATHFQVLAPVVRTRRASSPTLRQTEHPGLQPRTGRRRGPSADRATDAEEAGEARHRGGDRPSTVKASWAAAHRPGGDRPVAGRRDRRLDFVDRDEHDPATGSSGSPRSWPAPTGTRVLPSTTLSHGRSRSTPPTAPARSAVVWASAKKSTLTSWCPGSRPPGRRRGGAMGDGSQPDYFTRMLAASARWMGFDIDTRGASFRPRHARRFSRVATSRCNVRYRNRYGRTRSYYADFGRRDGLLQRRTWTRPSPS